MAPLSGLLGGHVDQIALLVPDLEAAMDAYVASLGVTFGVFEVTEATSSFSGSSPQFRIRIAVALVGLVSIELIQPVSGVTLYSKHLETRGPGIHHLGVYVDDLAEAKEGLAGRGYESILEGRIDGLGEFAYFDAPDMHCILEPLQLSSDLPLFLAENATWYSGR
jgi:methylmalonyl-CoA/ethylmalonyl-CoA epimerase